MASLIGPEIDEILLVKNLTTSADLAGRHVPPAENVALSIDRHRTASFVSQSGPRKSIPRGRYAPIDTPPRIARETCIVQRPRSHGPPLERSTEWVQFAFPVKHLPPATGCGIGLGFVGCRSPTMRWSFSRRRLHRNAVQRKRVGASRSRTSSLQR